jgi:hypothetical protein
MSHPRIQLSILRQQGLVVMEMVVANVRRAARSSRRQRQGKHQQLGTRGLGHKRLMWGGR